VLLLGLGMSLPLLADRYAYQDRGDRHEGIRPKPVSGDDIQIVSARAEPVGWPVGEAPEQMHLRFFLPADGPVHVTVRELDYRYYYWLDRVRPRQAWQGGQANAFSWPTGDVLLWLYDRGLEPADLGAVVRLTPTSYPTAEERVAPAVLAGDDRPVAVESYLFTFKTNMPARLSCHLYREGRRKPVWSKTFKRVSAGRPFTCPVPTDRLDRGSHRLVVDGYSLDTSAPVTQEVAFFHSPELR
jgi:hypothetical protein